MRRSASVLVFVMAILGVLFVTGIAFMSMMNFEAQMIDAERQRGGTGPRAEELLEDVERILGDDIAADPDAAPEAVNIDDLISSFGDEFAVLPGVHNVFAPIEPYRKPKPPRDLVYPWFTDPFALLARDEFGNKSFYKGLEPNTEWLSGLDPDPAFPPELTPVDADGDGIVDAMEVDIANFGILKAQYRALAGLLNPISKPDGRVFLGLRVIDHGAMINVNDSHPTLLANILDAASLPFENNHNPPYSPLVEEAALRRRGFLPSKQLPATRLQGNPLDSADPGSVGGDFAVRLFPPKEDLWDHRFWPFGPDEIDSKVDPARTIWSIRMDPAFAAPHRKDDEYDRRHLVTTISHDDLLRRDTWVTLPNPTALPGQPQYVRVNVLDLMARANMAVADPDSKQCPAVLPFEYLAYPYDVPDSYHMVDPPDEPLDWCGCYAEPGCTLNPRKGRLRLSLPWLQEQLDAGLMTQEQQIRLIQDAFMLLLLNARGPEWGFYEAIDADGDGTLDVPVDLDGDGVIDRVPRMWVPYDTLPGGPPGCDPSDVKCNNPIAWTAAALTANLIDFADDDEFPDATPVELRSADYTDLDCSDAMCFGEPMGTVVYGLERQPFITEVVVMAAQQDRGGAKVLNPPIPWPAAGWDAFFGIELFNPYDDALPLAEYELRINGATLTDGPLTFAFPVLSLNAGRFVGFHGGAPMPPVSSSGRELEAIVDLWFDETSKIELVWRPGGINPGIVVDEVDLAEQPVSSNMLGLWDGELRSSQRDAYALSHNFWTAPVPIDFVNDPDAVIEGSSRIGFQGARNNPNDVRPVEVQFADTGTLDSAFPTTGSLLLLMRYANSEDRAFTSYLGETNFVLTAAGPTVQKTTSFVDQRQQIDNGRMPLFDPGMLNHTDPMLVEPVEGDPVVLTEEAPGALEHLPWGQLIFDYFTALPLQSDGPYVDLDDDGDIDIDDHAPPKVDLDGLRVHGRININAAPWMVLKGLPYLPMSKIPETFRSRFRDILFGLTPPDDEEPQPIGPALAKAVVAYRELRGIEHGDLEDATGQYGDGSTAPDPNGRSWTLDAPTLRRGMGFMTVGELANVRHAGAAGGAYRVDSGVLGDPSSENYLDAIAVLASLGDWVSVRSQVFTLYGSLRGEPEEDPGPMSADADELKKQKEIIEDVNARALRFQETIDRLPVFLGGGAPARIGDRSITAYHDVLND